MAKRLKTDESGDSDDLQALFDSITESAPAGAPAVSPAVVKAVASVVDESGDLDDLQALFDSVASGGSSPSAQVSEDGETVNIKDLAAAASSMSPEERHQQAFQQIGQLTRLLHDTIRQLGYDKMLEETAEKLPDARQRLSYISQMTEQAASRVLNATDIAKPIQDRIELQSSELSTRWSKLYNKELSVAEFEEQLASDTRAFLDQSTKDSKQVNEQLLEIMMAQDFQDLTGQVIKRIVDMASKMESGLLKVLIEIMPDSKREAAEDGLLNGPVVNAEGREDVVTSQEQVDDLLDSLGF